MMNSQHHIKVVHEGRYAVEIEVGLIDTDTGWPPYFSLLDAQKWMKDEQRSGAFVVRPIVRRIRFSSQSVAES